MQTSGLRLNECNRGASAIDCMGDQLQKILLAGSVVGTFGFWVIYAVLILPAALYPSSLGRE